MLIVKKFGGTSVANKERIFNVARRCIEDYKAGHDVVVVLSAMGDTTDELIELANSINPDAKKRELDMLLTTGEQVSVSLMAMAMQALDVPAVSLNAFQVAMHATSRYGNARFKRVDTKRIRHELDSRKIVIVTGFQGVNKYDDITTLGRGGSDTTAVALSAVLHADKCEIYTDVDGVFTADPRIVKNAKKLDFITYDEMLELASLGAKVLHNRSVEMAKKYNVEAVMIGRGLIANPQLVNEIKGQEKLTKEMLKQYHDRLYRDFEKIMKADKHLLFKMKEFWNYVLWNFEDENKCAKLVRKCQNLYKYNLAVEEIFGTMELK